jgi:hypothetical protein
MISDFKILRIPENSDLKTIKEAYRKIVKEIHPDVSGNTFEKHILFIQISKAYERLVKKYSSKETTLKQKHKSPVTGKNGIINHKDPAYVFYKAGMNFFMKIHPSQWQIDTQKIMEKPGLKDLEELEKIKSKVKELVKLFPKAYYYFSIVVHEYPDSIWFRDSRDKMTLIEERTVMYKKIIDSFTEHAKDVPRINKMFFNKSVGH